MKTIGFIYEHNPILYSLRFDEFKKKCTYDNEMVLKHLKKGSVIATTMHVISSLIKNDNQIIGGILYLTDGDWIWTNYLSYYVEKESIELPEDFLNHIKNASKEKQKLDALKIENAVNFLKKNII
ncbi:hypothetical protein FNW52_15845 [Flavobacterium sp. ZT3R18]|uniref:hypothetical protein n=1 Tax=Flavobacterium sp. ZT3R18 TaxID=2594429 RepID=UPI00119098DB|nr:hypothetical protein [Flavobacterium sp. ZT3R18]TRX33230.1 hypothetical protein FNW52_15845 [Flavobacterium sp. ZT3R18]